MLHRGSRQWISNDANQVGFYKQQGASDPKGEEKRGPQAFVGEDSGEDAREDSEARWRGVYGGGEMGEPVS